MQKIGITGGIGSGKTTCCRIFEALDIPVYYADEGAKRLMYKNKKLKTEIKKVLGEEAYHNNGKMNKVYIGSKIFTDKSLLKKVNNLVHPAVAMDVMNWFGSIKNKPYALEEAALLIESGAYKFFDELIVVTAPIEKRVEWVMKRDNLSKKEVTQRLKNQLSDEERIKKANFVIINDGTISLTSQVYTIHKQLTKRNK